MAGLYAYCNIFPLAGKDKLAKEAFIDGNNIPAVSCALTPALFQAPAFTPDPPSRYTDEDLQRVTKLALESFAQG